MARAVQTGKEKVKAQVSAHSRLFVDHDHLPNADHPSSLAAESRCWVLLGSTILGLDLADSWGND